MNMYMNLLKKIKLIIVNEGLFIVYTNIEEILEKIVDHIIR